jgi:hypothetical protein
MSNTVQYIVCSGNVIVGNRFFGPFRTTEEATAWGDANFDNSGYIVAQVNAPAVQQDAWVRSLNFRADAPVNPEFRGAERPRAGQDY